MKTSLATALAIVGTAFFILSCKYEPIMDITTAATSGGSANTGSGSGNNVSNIYTCDPNKNYFQKTSITQ